MTDVLPIFNPEPLLPFQEHAQPSIDAASSMKPYAWNLREKIYETLAKYALSGLSDEQISDLTGISLNTVRPRRGELVKADRIESAGTRAGRSGRQMTVWVVKR
jgi:hypothetical protein